MTTKVNTAGIDSSYRSGQQKTSDRPGMTAGTNSAPTAKRDFGDKASDAANDIADKAKDAGDTIMDKASDIGHSMQETGHNIAEKSKHAHNAVCDFTKKNPTAAILLAFGVGAILARILPKR